jgi:hypothetical protein
MKIESIKTSENHGDVIASVFFIDDNGIAYEMAFDSVEAAQQWAETVKSIALP